MSFANLLNKTATVKRLTDVGDKSTYASVGSFACHIQQMTPEETNFIGGVFGRTFKVYAKEDADVGLSDEITIDSVAYKIKAIKTLTYGNLPHLEIVAVLPDD